MKENKNTRKDNLSAVDSTKRVYKMYKKKKHWVCAPVVFAVMASNLLGAPLAVMAAEEATEVETEAVATEVQEVAEPVAEATPYAPEAMTDSEREQIRQDALTFIGKLKWLSDEEKDGYATDITKIVAVDGISKEDFNLQVTTKVAEIINQSKEDLVVRTVSGALSEVAAFTGIDHAKYNNAINALKGQIDTSATSLATALNGFNVSTTAALDFYNNAPKAIEDYDAIVDAKFDQIKLEVQKAAVEYQEVNTELSQVKEAAMNTVDGLENFTDAEKAIVIHDIEKATTKEEVTALVNAAIDGNHGKFLLAKKELQNYINGKVTDFGDKSDFIAKLAETKSVADVEALKAEVDAYLAQGDLNSFKEKYNKHINQGYITVPADKEYGYLTIEEKTEYMSRISKASTKAEVIKIAFEAQENSYLNLINKKATSVATAQTEATKLIIRLTNLDPASSTIFKDQISKAKDKATLQDIIAEAVAENNGVFANLDALKSKAVAEVEALGSLKPSDKMFYIDWINNEETIAGVKKALSDAKTFNTKQELLAYANSLANEINDMTVSASDLPVSKATFVAPLTDTSANAKKYSVYHATSKDDALRRYTIVKVANIQYKLVDALGSNASVNDTDKATAALLFKQEINALEYLSGAQKTAFIKEASDYAAKTDSKAKLTAKYKDVYKAASKLNQDNKDKNAGVEELEKLKENAVSEIEGMEYIPANEKVAFIAEVNKATNKKTVENVLNNARLKDDEFKADLNKLREAKKEAILKLKGLNKLSDVEYADFVSKIDDASSIGEVQRHLADAQYLNSYRETEVAVSLTNAKTKGKAAVSALTPELTNIAIGKYHDEINNAASIDAVLAIVEKAKTKADQIHDTPFKTNTKKLIADGNFQQAQAEINKIRNDAVRASLQAELDAAIQLSDAKTKAYKTIDALTEHSQAEKDAAKVKVGKAKDVEAVAAIVDPMVEKDNKLHDAPIIDLVESEIKAGEFDKAQANINKIRDAKTKKDLQAKLDVATRKATVSYQAHVQNHGWMNPVKDGGLAGTSGEAKRMEAVKISVDSPLKGDIMYKTHVQNIGWQGFVNGGELAGTTGEAKRLEAIQIKLTDDLAKEYDVYYRVHVQDIGWMGWAKNGASAGTQGKAKRMEAMEVKLVKKGEAAPGSTDNSFVEAK